MARPVIKRSLLTAVTLALVLLLTTLAPGLPTSDTASANTCFHGVFGGIVGGNKVWGQTFSSCDGAPLGRQHWLYREKCQQDIVICWVWSNGPLVAFSNIPAGPGTKWTPLAGVVQSGALPSGLYRIRTHQEISYGGGGLNIWNGQREDLRIP